MIEISDFLKLNSDQKAQLIAEHVLEADAVEYPSWTTTVAIINHLRSLGLIVQLGFHPTSVNVGVLTFLGDEEESRSRAMIFVLQGEADPEMAELEGIHVSTIPEHDAVAIAALVVANVIAHTPAA